MIDVLVAPGFEPFGPDTILDCIPGAAYCCLGLGKKAFSDVHLFMLGFVWMFLDSPEVLHTFLAACNAFGSALVSGACH